MTEFTGERVIPGQVHDDLWAEHVARYALAARFAQGRRVLDLGCGTGYGTADLARVASSAVGVDVSEDAIAYARSHFPSARFLRGSATAVPFPSASFEMITAFEVIEHLCDGRRLLSEAKRLLASAGLLVVSTPNKRYYAEARAKSGPNPFHEHEFTYDEFQAALGEFFPHARILFQNRIEAFAFYGGAQTSEAKAQLASSPCDPENANFFIGICSSAPLPDTPSYIYVPRAANLLREREEHIRLLEEELANVKTWLDQTMADRNTLLTVHTDLQRQFHAEQTRAAEIISDLNAENRRKTEWALETEQRLTSEIEKRVGQLTEAIRLLDRAEATVAERTGWARSLDAQLQETQTQLALVRQSRWLKLGRQMGLGPRVEE